MTLPPRLASSIPVLALILGSLFAVSLLGSVTAEDGTPGAGPGHGARHPSGTPSTDSPYAAGYDPAAAIRALSPEEIGQIERGEGAGYALPAELNGVPGPSHVLALADEVRLSPDQKAQVQTIVNEMRATVIPAGRRYLAAQQALEADFRAGALSEADLPDRVAAVARLEGELAAAHLLAHLRTAKILTPEQIAGYNQLRGYE